MANILIVYGSTTGNNQALAEGIEEVLTEEGHEVDIGTGSEFSPSDIKDYDFSFIGSSTWGDGDMQDDMVDFVEDLKEEDLSGTNVAIFGNGMSSFPKFCHAAEQIEEAASQSGAEIIGDTFKVDGDVYDAMDDAKDRAKSLVD